MDEILNCNILTGLSLQLMKGIYCEYSEFLNIASRHYQPRQYKIGKLPLILNTLEVYAGILQLQLCVHLQRVIIIKKRVQEYCRCRRHRQHVRDHFIIQPR